VTEALDWTSAVAAFFGGLPTFLFTSSWGSAATEALGLTSAVAVFFGDSSTVFSTPSSVATSSGPTVAGLADNNASCSLKYAMAS